MPRPPETPRNAFRRWVLGIAVLSVPALAGLYLVRQAPEAPGEAPRVNLAARLSEAGRDLRDAFTGSKQGLPAERVAGFEQSAPFDEAAPPPGSMQESLLNAADGHRVQLFWRAIGDAGLECAEIRAVGPLGDGGSAWRANCGDASVYLIEVGEFGRLSVVPMPYGDVYPPGSEINVPEQGIRYEFPE
jgi:hypothetical protein